MISRPLSWLIKASVPFYFDKDYQGAFQELKKRLTEVLLLYYYDYSLETRVKTNASDSVVTGVLS